MYNNYFLTQKCTAFEYTEALSAALMMTIIIITLLQITEKFNYNTSLLYCQGTLEF